ncbi:tetratricopeptide repeat protein [Halodesulfovibrio aestuarii]|uniref:Tetratricopeptide repeat protein n=1 Tax=Halodesulfovibrio aestuarii TaxID=126333 RepID=A0ABV4JUA8_9BACT
MIRNSLYIILISFVLLSGCAKTNTASQDVPEFTDAVAKALALQKEGNFQESLVWYAQALKIKETPQLRNGAGAALLSSGSTEAALKEFDRALTFTPSSPDIQANRGTALFRLKEYDEALDSFNKALSYNPAHAQALNGKALVQLTRKHYDSALILLIQAQKAAPEKALIKYNSAIAFEAAGLLEDAEKAFTQYIKETPKDAKAFNGRGVVRMKLKKYAASAQDFDNAIALSPTNGKFYYNRGLLWQKQLKYTDAIKDYTRSIAYTPDNGTTYVNRGNTYFLLDEKEKGCRDLKKACSMGLCEKLEAYKNINSCIE